MKDSKSQQNRKYCLKTKATRKALTSTTSFIKLKKLTRKSSHYCTMVWLTNKFGSNNTIIISK